MPWHISPNATRWPFFWGAQDSQVTSTFRLWHDGLWHQPTYSTKPPAIMHGEMVYFPARRGLVLVGGIDAFYRQPDIWLFDGDGWQNLGPSPTTENAAIVYDAQRERLLLVPTQWNGSMTMWWSLDGTSWHALSPAAIPSARINANFGYDAARGHVVMHGGQTASNQPALRDTWVFEDNDWRLAAATLTGATATRWRMAFDAQRGALFAIDNDLRALRQWTGSAWLQVTPPLQGYGFAYPELVYRSATQDLLVISYTNVVYKYTAEGLSQENSRTWPDLNLAAYMPSLQALVAVGSNETRVRQGHLWRRAAHPFRDGSFVGSAALAYDSKRTRLVLFGWVASPELQPETWQFDGQAWTRLATTGPTARIEHAMAYDVVRDAMVLIGGDMELSGNLANDHWEFRNNAWQRRDNPPFAARRNLGMAYDELRQHVILFGGQDATNRLLGDTWRFDGAAWTEVPVAAPPSPRANASLTYDPLCQCVVMVGGAGQSGALRDAWNFDGVTWRPRQPATLPEAQVGQALVFDPTQRALIWGEWQLHSVATNTSAESCVASEDLDNDGLMGCTDPDCWATCTPMCVPTELAGGSWPQACDAVAQHCGDGSCQRSVETSYNCPSDCPWRD